MKRLSAKATRELRGFLAELEERRAKLDRVIAGIRSVIADAPDDTGDPPGASNMRAPAAAGESECVPASLVPGDPADRAAG